MTFTPPGTSNLPRIDHRDFGGLVTCITEPAGHAAPPFFILRFPPLHYQNNIHSIPVIAAAE
jgi:hypothetical protein